MEQIANYIGGELVRPSSGEYFDNVNPATGKVYSLIPDSGEADVEHAVEAIPVERVQHTVKKYRP